MKNAAMVKSTINISAENFEMLKQMVANEAIDSMTEGINEGIRMLIREYERKQYEAGMAKAAQDPNFIERTMKCQKEFDAIDCGVNEEW